MNAIVIGRMTEQDCDAVACILKNDTVRKTYMVPDLTDTEARKLALRMIALSQDSERYVRGVYLGKQLIGFLNDTGIGDRSIELGWVIAPSHHNRGYATAAVRVAMGELFAIGYEQIIAGAFADNIPSIRVMQKVGMTLMDKTEEIEYRGETHHCVYYQMHSASYTCCRAEPAQQESDTI